MADLFKIGGVWSTTPSTGGLMASGAVSMQSPISESVMLAQKNFDDYHLEADAVQAIAFGGCEEAHVVMITADRKIEARFTSADGATQSLAGEFFHLISRTVPYTAIDIQRVAGQETRVKVFIGEKTS